MTCREIAPNVIACDFSGDGPNDCPDDANGRHYFIHLDPNYNGRMCMDCGQPEVPAE